MLLRKNESSLEKKNGFTEGFFQPSRNPVSKRKVYLMKVVIQNSAIKYYHEFLLKSHKNLEILILAACFLLLARIILKWPYVRLLIQFRGRKNFLNGKNFLLRVM